MAPRTDHREAIQRNLEQMGTALDEWRAAPMRRGRDGQGRPVLSFALPAGYEHAPTLFPDPRRAAEAAGAPEAAMGLCELCGHRIGQRFWIYCDRRRLTLTVGSECIKQFRGRRRGCEGDRS
jgi:hypothetical protein